MTYLILQFNPGFNIRSLLYVFTSPNSFSETSTTSRSWLPAPGSFKGIFASKSGSVNDGSNNKFHGYDTISQTTNAYSYSYVTFKQNGKTMVLEQSNNGVTQPTNQNQQTNVVYAKKDLYIRSLTIYEGGRIYSNLDFSGEAKNTMFNDGKFNVIIVEQLTGKVLAHAHGVAQSNWTVPGWARFQVRFASVLPSQATSCAMIFEAGKPTGINGELLRVAVPVKCN